jgi:hypothetical protein
MGLDINGSEMFCFKCNAQFALASHHPELMALHEKIVEVIDQVDEIPSLNHNGVAVRRTPSSDPSKIMLFQSNFDRFGAPSPRIKDLVRHEQHLTAG